MFFTPELLARRDSGFGLLWLAATLGSKSTFKRLPKRTVLTADIAQLCNLIVQPNEPLALRLSSNLMIGAARIYKVKQEIFFSDVNTCVASLKKAVHELHALGEAQLQMAQPTLRSAAVTLVPDPKNAFMMEFDMLVADWDEYLDLDGPPGTSSLEHVDDDYDPSSATKKAKGKARHRPLSEVGNVSAHTLVEHHEHILSASFDLGSINQNLPIDSASGNEDFAFGDFFPIPDEPAITDMLGDELARELGWESPTPLSEPGRLSVVPEAVDLLMNMEADDAVPPLRPDLDDHQMVNDPANLTSTSPNANALDNLNGAFSTPQMVHQQIEPMSRGGQSPPGASEAQPIQFLGDITNKGEGGGPTVGAPRPRTKRHRVLPDARTELTDDELKIARIQYIQAQAIQRRENQGKRLDKEHNRLVEARIFGAPTGVIAPALADFWQANLKAHLDAKGGSIVVQERPKKRRKTVEKRKELDMGPMHLIGDEDVNIADEDHGPGSQAPETGLYRSSEEPGQARYASRPPSAVGSNLGIDVGIHENLSQTQQSFMFPWDNAGPSSSIGGAPFRMSSDNHNLVEQADVRLRGSSRSRRESPLSPSHLAGNLVPDDFSPAPVVRGSQEDYQFDVKSSAPNSVIAEPRQHEIHVPALERNSLNFLEYTKMQFNTLPNSAQELSFDTIAPKSTSTRHVAAAAFYHCLVLGTKDLLRFRQTEPYGPIAIAISK